MPFVNQLVSAIAAITAALSLAVEGSEVYVAPPTEATFSISAVIEVGTTSTCGMREAPHLIEHLLLSETIYGETPVDAILNLSREGIKLSAFTHSDYTEIALKGPEKSALKMQEALSTFISRAELPKQGFMREKQTIINELTVDKAFKSRPSLYEHFISAYAGGASACNPDQSKFTGYSYVDVQELYESLYRSGSIRFVAQGDPTLVQATRLSTAFTVTPATDTAIKPEQAASPDVQLEIFGRDGVVEYLFPIAGRTTLPSDAAQAIADEIRLSVQAYIRKNRQLYYAKTYVDQSLKGGWIRLEVPLLTSDEADAIGTIATSAANRIDVHDFKDDPIWQAYGSIYAEHRVRSPLVASQPVTGGGVFDLIGRYVEKIIE